MAQARYRHSLPLIADFRENIRGTVEPTQRFSCFAVQPARATLPPEQRSMAFPLGITVVRATSPQGGQRVSRPLSPLALPRAAPAAKKGGLPTICQEVETRFVWPSVTGIHPCRKPREPVREPRPPHRPQAAGCALERRLRQRQPGRGPGRSRCRHAAWHRRRSGADRPPNAGRAHDRGRGRVAPDTCCG